MARRTQAERTAGTRAALVAAARPLFATKGYAGVGTDELATAAGVTRGALYHQFGGKEGLFAAVYEELSAEIVEQLGGHRSPGSGAADPLVAVRASIDAWLAVCARPDVHRIVLLEAPAALGYAQWREIGRRHGVGLVEDVVADLVASGLIRAQPATPLAHVLIGALEEAALYAARAEPADRDRATAEARTALLTLVEGLAGGRS
ncbi:TetR/AcrR family transcriptional regulator [Nocardioides litoris]|uniref:TetR/AcrR family transcriptional regulator n=1 Tax=Nocardioides litoris TaxID=1926648 RepID=UPI0011224722|nr:TetR/AcrR family transcriptional regulator [Nocardioides litoris]